MMFVMHVAIMVGIIALATGVSLYIWSLRNQGAGVGIAKFFGVLIIILAIVDGICISYYGFKYWMEGYFENPMNMMQMQNKSMMESKGMSDKMMHQKQDRENN